MDYFPNPLAVFVAGLVPMIVGIIWYGPLFGQKWMDLSDKTEEQLRAESNPMKQYGLTFVAGLLAAFVLAHGIQAYADAYGATGWAYGMQGAFWVWLGYVVWVTWQQVAFDDKPVVLWLINVFYNLAALLGMGAILGVWR